MVVRVVVRDLTDGAGDENVLSAPLPVVLIPPPVVAIVPSPEEAQCDLAASECGTSCSVDKVGATDLFPSVGARPSREERKEDRLCSAEEPLVVTPVGAVAKEAFRVPGLVVPPFMWPDSGYGLFFDGLFFFNGLFFLFELFA